MEGFTLIAHRGDSQNCPENTLPAFASAGEKGFPAFELDVQLTADGHVVVLHDEVLGRTTLTAEDCAAEGAGAGADPSASGRASGSGARRVAEATWAEVAALDAGSWFGPGFACTRVPLLSEVLCGFPGAHIHLELKSRQPGLPAAVAAELAACGWVRDGATAPASNRSRHTPHPAATVTPGGAGDAPGSAAGGAVQAPVPPGAAGPGEPGDGGAAAGAADRSVWPPGSRPHPALAAPGLTVTSFHLEQLRASVQLLPGVAHGWLIHEMTSQRIEEAVAAGLSQLCPRANALSPGDVRRAVAAGLSVRAWGVKDVQLLSRVVGCGCHGATVNGPAEAAQALLEPGAAALAAEEGSRAEAAALAAGANGGEG
ncbi:hypothetical protein HYH03_002638 [Edaphochlamys debaryana]|uniref:glycerophosphodiester phosphodiesterase n=1 Tax=Edaphochlamys debaryana TaxID=47281 RepID=A0A835YEE3_9CHLO|nr:hypothetical protein HYH03_002638 [Edaphochlamys debaryana]|eukprot:KAG2499703.1 hypothetical protein HYH03_002638 [Edaphochlamys debaryana]